MLELSHFGGWFRRYAALGLAAYESLEVRRDLRLPADAMKVETAIPDYSRDTGLRIDWEPGYQVSIEVRGDEVTISANRAGVLSLARLFLQLSQPGLPLPYHVHLDEWNNLEPLSAQLVVEVDDRGSGAATDES